MSLFHCFEWGPTNLLGQNQNPKLTKTVVCACILEISKHTKKSAIMLTLYSTWGLLDNIRGEISCPL